MPDPPAPELFPHAVLEPVAAASPRMRSRWIVPPAPEGWNGYALSEWELEGAEYTDRHPHDELNLVLAGELHVEVDGVVVVGRPGDAVRVPGGATGTYRAPRYARMLAVYGPNPDGATSDHGPYREIAPPADGAH